jgi:hypothetical protein
MAEEKRPPTSGTRKGNGAGWGGPAKGSRATKRYVFDESGPGRGHKSDDGEARRLRNEQRAEALEQFYWDVARGEAHGDDLPIRLSAATMLLNRIMGPGSKGEIERGPTKIIITGGLPDREW